MRASRALALLGALLLASSAVGFFFVDAWYHDDACSIDAWKCQAADLGVFALFYGLPLGVILIVVAAVIARFDPSGQAMLKTGAGVAFVLGAGLLLHVVLTAPGGAEDGPMTSIGVGSLVVALVAGVAARWIGDRKGRADGGQVPKNAV